MSQPTSLKHKLFEAALAVKGFNGLLEVIFGLLLLCVPVEWIDKELLKGFALLTTATLHLAHALQAVNIDLAPSSKTFMSIFLLGHGIVKVVLVFFLYKEKPWAFPVALVGFSALIIFQLHRILHTHSVALACFTLLDIFVVWFIWREYQARRAL